MSAFQANITETRYKGWNLFNIPYLGRDYYRATIISCAAFNRGFMISPLKNSLSAVLEQTGL